MSEMDARTHDPDLHQRDELAGLGFETSEADAAEQHQSVRDDQAALPRSVPFDVDPADAAEQARFVDLDEDDYR